MIISEDQFIQNSFDPRWRLQNLYSIVDKQGNRIPFAENNVQKRINDSTSKRKIILKARQFGVSTNELIKLLDWVLFTENATACIIAHEDSAIEKLFRIPRLSYELLPDYLKPPLYRGGGSMYEMYFPTMNSRIYCALEVRGGTVGKLHVSEAAFMKDSAKLKATLQAVPLATGQVTLETTPNGMANFFYDMWNDPDSIYEKMFFPWYVFPEYRLSIGNIVPTKEEILLKEKAKKMYKIDLTDDQISFRRFKKSEMKKSDYDKKLVPFEQEYPEDDKTCFLSSGESVLDLFRIDEMLRNAPEPIIIKSGIKIYKEFDKTKFYVCAADPAEGVGKDSSAAIIIDCESLEVCAVYNGFLKPADFAAKLVDMCGLYTVQSRIPPVLAVERNNHGHAVLLELDDHLQYPNLYMHPDEKLGWRSDGITRPLMIDKFIEAVDNGYLKIYDKDILNECLTLINNKGKIEAASGKHDDLIISCAIALQIKPDSRFSYDDLDSRIKL
jgi:hypothetical protein